jgi:tRNA (guanine37-N1)-methyltransferase
VRFDILTLFPGMFAGPFSDSIIRRAQDSGAASIHLWNFRDWATDRHRTVDDYPYGGGAGMVLKPEPIFACLDAVFAQAPRTAATRVVLMTPQGRLLTQQVVSVLAAVDRLVLICGHYEGFDERIRTLADDEISIGDYVLTGGELPAMVVVDAVIRHLPGVLGSSDSLDEESHSAGLLEYPHYTRPPEFRGMRVPDVLLSGNHAEIAKWRHAESIQRTRQRRPDLLRPTDH